MEPDALQVIVNFTFNACPPGWLRLTIGIGVVAGFLMLTVGIPEIATVPETAVVPCGETGTGCAAVFPTVTVPPTVVVPWAATGTGASVVFTTLTGEEYCACAVATKHILTQQNFIF